MIKRIISLFLVCTMLLLCGCGRNSGNGDISTNNISRETGPTQELAVEDPEFSAPSTATTKIEGPGFVCPEEAILAYAQELQQGDVEKILSSFAIETYVEHYDLATKVEILGAYTFTIVPPLPNSNAYTAELNKVFRQYAIVQNLAYMYMSLSDVEYNGQPITFNENPYSNPQKLVDDLSFDNWMSILSDMEIGNVLTFEDFFESSEQYQQALANRCRELGCEELVPLAVEITLDGETYYLCVDVACYNGSWYNCNAFGMIATYFGAELMYGGLCPAED